MPRVAKRKRVPTLKERLVGEALADWLQEVGAEILSQREQSRGRWLTVWSTPYGCVMVSTTDNRVTGIAAQIQHDDPDAMLNGLATWSSTKDCSPVQRPRRAK